MLDGGRTELVAQFHHQGFALVAFGALDADLDQFVRLKCALEFCNDGGRKAIAGYRDNRIEVVGAGAQFAAPGGRELDHRFFLRGAGILLS